jgi:hypothetical protein
MKTVAVFSSGFEAHLIAGKLESDGFTVFLNGAREYVAVLAGGDLGRYELQVPDDEVEDVTKTLAQYKKDAEKYEPVFIAVDADPNAKPVVDTPGWLLKKAVFFSVMGITPIPLVFNYYSMQNATKYARLEKSKAKKIFWLTFITLTNAISVWIGLSFISYIITRDL